MLELKQTQRLQAILTPQLQQAIKLLQLSQIELMEAIEQELKENPLLEIAEEKVSDEGFGEETAEEPRETAHENDDMDELLDRFSPTEEFSEREEKGYLNYENIVKKTSGLRDYIRWQAGLSDFDAHERQIAEWIIENINDNGYLAYSLAEISSVSCYSDAELESVLKKIHRFDPPGIGARDLKECILLQYEAKGGRDPVFIDIVGSCFDMLQGNNLKAIVKKTGYSLEKIKSVLEEIRSFDPKPGRNFSDEQIPYIIPDVYVVKTDDGFEVFLNEEDIPDLQMNRYYMELNLNKEINGDTRKYLKNKIKQAEWFIKSLKQRQRTLYLVSKSIVSHQLPFFEGGIRFLKPLNLRDVAGELGIHESTVSRITTNKYISTPHGIFEMKFFFPTGINMNQGEMLSTNVVMDLVKELIEGEDKHNPLTDDEIVSILKVKRGIAIARRTVAKYRDMLNILSSRGRKID
ncbi:MAG: RNA polymerase factor sigma-54 [Syntrophorhabdaceae bacterium]|nr:RNA polymerase factor sigma-54 [Syntrophorhabdales bacterium]MBP9560231.1 RNA polymerase factor sigma-54 [Syntrophorhabdaceae bacterium]